MICKKCGAEIGDYASFCTYCGNPVGNHGVDLNKTSSSEAESAPPPGYSDPIPRDDREPTQQPGMGYIPEFNRMAESKLRIYPGGFAEFSVFGKRQHMGGN